MSERTDNQDLPSKRRRHILAGAVGVGVVLAGCSGDDNSSGGTDDEDTESANNDDPTQNDSENSDDEPTPDDGEEPDSEQTEQEQQDDAPPDTVTVEPGESVSDALQRVASGGTVELSSGAYEQLIDIQKQVTLTAPNGATLDGSGQDSEAVVTVGADSVTIEGIEIIGGGIAGIETSDPVTEFTLADITCIDTTTGVSGSVESAEIRNVVVEESTSTAISIGGSRNGSVSIAEPVVDISGGAGIVVEGGSSVTVENPDLFGTDDDGIRITGGDTRDQTVSVSGGSVVESSGAGIVVTGTDGTDDVSVSDTELLDNGEFGATVDGDEVSLTGLTVSGNGPADAGLSISGSRDGTVTVSQTTVEQTGEDVSFGSGPVGYGISVTDGESVTFDNVTLTSNGGRGFEITSETVRGQTVDVTSCTIADCFSPRVGGSDGTDTITLSETTVENSGTLSLTGDDIALTNCEVTDAGERDAGLEITSSSEGEVTVSDTTVTRTEFSQAVNSSGDGISITDGEAVTVENTSVTDNGGAGLHIRTEGARGRTVDVVGCDAVGNGDRSESAIQIDGTNGEDTVTVENTTVESFGKLYVAGDSVTVSGCEVSDVGERDEGVEIESTADGEVTVTDTTVRETTRDGALVGEPNEFGHGLAIYDGETVTVENSTFAQNGGDNLQIADESGDVSGRTVTVDTVEATGSAEADGIQVDGTSGSDTVTLRNSRTENNADNGYELGGESVTIENCSASANGSALTLLDISRSEAEITGSSL
jgi:hypothetical protein